MQRISDSQLSSVCIFEVRMQTEADGYPRWMLSTPRGHLLHSPDLPEIDGIQMVHQSVAACPPLPGTLVMPSAGSVSTLQHVYEPDAFGRPEPKYRTHTRSSDAI